MSRAFCENRLQVHGVAFFERTVHDGHLSARPAVSRCFEFRSVDVKGEMQRVKHLIEVLSVGVCLLLGSADAQTLTSSTLPGIDVVQLRIESEPNRVAFIEIRHNIGLFKRQFGLLPERRNQPFATTHTAQRAASRLAQVPVVLGTHIGGVHAASSKPTRTQPDSTPARRPAATPVRCGPGRREGTPAPANCDAPAAGPRSTAAAGQCVAPAPARIPPPAGLAIAPS